MSEIIIFLRFFICRCPNMAVQEANDNEGEGEEGESENLGVAPTYVEVPLIEEVGLSTKQSMARPFKWGKKIGVHKQFNYFE